MTRVTFVGAGPGAADLITVRGARALASATWCCSMRWPTRRCASSAPAGRVDRRRQARLLRLDRAGAHQRAARQARARRRPVVRLKGGDPSVFGRLEEELEALAAAGIECEVVPGVTAALAAAAATQRPLTRRGTGRSVAPDDGDDARRRASAPAATPTPRSFYMAGKQLAALVAPPRRGGLAGRRRRCSSSRAPAGPTSSRATTASPTLGDADRAALRAGRRSSPSASARRRSASAAQRAAARHAMPPRPTREPPATP